MFNTKKTSIFTTFIFLLGTVFLVHCERQPDRTDQTDRTTTTQPGQTQPGAQQPGQQQQYDASFEDGRDNLKDRIDRLHSDLEDEIDLIESRMDDDAASADQSLRETHEKLRSDRDALERAKSNLDNATEQNWNNVRTENERVYREVSERFNERRTDRTTRDRDSDRNQDRI